MFNEFLSIVVKSLKLDKTLYKDNRNFGEAAIYFAGLIMILDGVAGAKFLRQGKFNHCFAILKAHFSFYSRIPSVLINRKRSLKIDSSIKYKKSILVDYFLKNNHQFSKLKW